MHLLRSSIITGTLLLTSALPVYATTGCNATGWDDRHADVQGCTLYYPAIAYLYKEGIVSGSPAPAEYGADRNVYRPFATINRAEFAKIILGASERATENCAQKPFPDVPLDAWFAPYVCSAKNAGLIAGYPDGRFRPEQPVNYAEASKILTYAFGLPFNPADTRFDETQNVWYRPYTNVMHARNAVPPSMQTYDQFITRGEMAEMTYRIMTGKSSLDRVADDPYEGEMYGLGRGFHDAEYDPDFVGAAGELFYIASYPEMEVAFPSTYPLSQFPGLNGTAKGYRFVHVVAKERCGLSGLAEHCKPQTYDADIALYTIPQNSGVIRRAVLAYGGGEEFMTERQVGKRPMIASCVRLGVEGENVDYCTLPLGNTHTLLIVRNWIDTNVMAMPGVMPTADQDRVFNDFLLAIEPGTPELSQTALQLTFFLEQSRGAGDMITVQRSVPKTTSVADASLRAVMAGPNAEEQTTGARHEPSCFDILTPAYRSVSITEGTATVHFTADGKSSFSGLAASLQDQCLSLLEINLLHYSTVGQVRFLWDK